MTNSYDPNHDLLDSTTPAHRAIAPTRDAQNVTPSDTLDLPIYGKLAVFNAGASTEVIRVVPVEYTDDSQHVDIKDRIGLTVIDWLVVRAVLATGTGADIKAVLLT